VVTVLASLSCVLTLLLIKASFLKHILRSWLKEEVVGQFHNPVSPIHQQAYCLIGTVKFSYIQASLRGSVDQQGAWKESVTYLQAWSPNEGERAVSSFKRSALLLKSALYFLKVPCTSFAGRLKDPAAGLDMLVKRKITVAIRN